jgi:hypothetical protein
MAIGGCNSPGGDSILEKMSLSPGETSIHLLPKVSNIYRPREKIPQILKNCILYTDHRHHQPKIYKWCS